MWLFNNLIFDVTPHYSLSLSPAVTETKGIAQGQRQVFRREHRSCLLKWVYSIFLFLFFLPIFFFFLFVHRWVDFTVIFKNSDKCISMVLDLSFTVSRPSLPSCSPSSSFLFSQNLDSVQKTQKFWLSKSFLFCIIWSSFLSIFPVNSTISFSLT